MMADKTDLATYYSNEGAGLFGTKLIAKMPDIG